MDRQTDRQQRMQNQEIVLKTRQAAASNANRGNVTDAGSEK